MSLYVGLFAGDTEVEGWVFGHYSDFGYFRDVVRAQVPEADAALLLGCSDCDAVFRPDQLPLLKAELESIAGRFRALPPIHPEGAFEHNQELWSQAKTLYDCFHNVDGENVFKALITLCDDGEA